MRLGVGGAPAPWPAPDYAHASLANVLPAALASLLGVPGPLPLPAADRVVVLLVDGLGAEQLPLADGAAPFLAAMAPVVPDGLDAGFSSTTPVSITTLGTGLPPGRHAMVAPSFLLPATGRGLSPLGWRDDPDPLTVQPAPTVFEQATRAGVACTNVGVRMFVGSGLTVAALRGARDVGADSPGEQVPAVAQAAAAARSTLTYSYFPAVDKSGHLHGAGSTQWQLDLEFTDRAIGLIADRLPGGTLLLVTSDHGMLNCPDERRIDVDGEDFLRGVRYLSGEPRVRHVYARAGVPAQELADRWAAMLGDAAVVATRQEVVEAGWYGPTSPEAAARIGDVVAVATADHALVSRRFDALVSSLRGQHGGLTRTEQKVPLLALQT
jgi:hypothetical protein